MSLCRFSCPALVAKRNKFPRMVKTMKKIPVSYSHQTCYSLSVKITASYYFTMITSYTYLFHILQPTLTYKVIQQIIIKKSCVMVFPMNVPRTYIKHGTRQKWTKMFSWFILPVPCGLWLRLFVVFYIAL